jgi:hypothetical protein
MAKNKTYLLGLCLLFSGVVLSSRADTASVTESTSTVKKKKKLSLLDLLNATGSSANHSTTVAGVRGLEETGGVVDTKARNYVAVEKLEAVVVHDDELARFVVEGKLR